MDTQSIDDKSQCLFPWCRVDIISMCWPMRASTKNVLHLHVTKKLSAVVIISFINPTYCFAIFPKGVSPSAEYTCEKIHDSSTTRTRSTRSVCARRQPIHTLLTAGNFHEMYNHHTGRRLGYQGPRCSTVENQLGRRRQILTIAQWNVRTLLDREAADRHKDVRHW